MWRRHLPETPVGRLFDLARDERIWRTARASPRKRVGVSCDASAVTVTRAPDGSVLDVGRKRRTVTPALRVALEARDRGCRFPGCGSRYTDAHHIEHWADGGETSLENTILLCGFHHWLLHEGGFRMDLNAWPGGRPTFYTPRGLPVAEMPAAIRLEDVTIEELTGLRPDCRTCSARSRSELDVPAETLTRLAEAMLPPPLRRASRRRLPPEQRGCAPLTLP